MKNDLASEETNRSEYGMYLARLFCVAPIFFAALPWRADGAGVPEPLLRQLGPGIFVESSEEVPLEQARSIGQKLGGELVRLTNSVLRVQGQPLRINVITAGSEEQAEKLERGILKVKPYPFCVRKGTVVAEYVGKKLDALLASKASYELGLVPKPKQVRYRVTAELALIEGGDYMVCNSLSNGFFQAESGASSELAAQIQGLAKQFRFGQVLKLRHPEMGIPAAHSFEPGAVQEADAGPVRTYRFEGMPLREGVPWVKASLEILVDDTGLSAGGAAPDGALAAATPFWPADDPKVRALAAQITRGKTGNGAKAMAILEWLAPGKHLKTGGPTGSRWGTMKVLEQQYGHCWDFSDVFVTLARASGVPSRQVAGWLAGASGHVWAEFWSEGRGWQQVDPTGGGVLRCGIYHIPYFTTETGEMPIVYLRMPRIEAVPAG